MAAVVGKYAVKKMLGREMNKYKNKKVADGCDPYFEQITLKNGKTKKVKKQIPDYIPEHDAKILAAAKKRAYSLDCCLFNFMGIRFGWSSVIGIVPEFGDVIDALMAVHLYKKCCSVEGGLDGETKRKMQFNICLDFFLGLVPFLGDLVDAAFKCNTRNVQVLETALMKKYMPNGMGLEQARLARLEPFEEDGDIRDMFNNEQTAPPDYSKKDPAQIDRAPTYASAKRGQGYSNPAPGPQRVPTYPTAAPMAQREPTYANAAPVYNEPTRPEASKTPQKSGAWREWYGGGSQKGPSDPEKAQAPAW